MDVWMSMLLSADGNVSFNACPVPRNVQRLQGLLLGMSRRCAENISVSHGVGERLLMVCVNRLCALVFITAVPAHMNVLRSNKMMTQDLRFQLRVFDDQWFLFKNFSTKQLSIHKLVYMDARTYLSFPSQWF